MQLFNSLTGRKETFEPAVPGRPTMYVCGPTVYNHPHIGNARPAVVFDVLFRLLRHRFGDVVYARNVTDVDDKIIAAAEAEGTSTEAIAARYTEAYRADMAALGVLEPTVEPFATAHVGEMIAMIARLIEQGHAYEVEGHVLFHVPSYPDYGRLSHRSRAEMIDGARVEVAPYKRDPADFVLWKPSTPAQPGWESAWGRGRPGWHIECSAMVEKHLGTTVDIHGGGQDLKFPHHENELAQSTCVHAGAPLARFWLHNGFVNVEHEKMSKSLGNVLLVKDLLEEAPGEAIRLALLGAHYRKPLDWTAEGLGRARHALDRLYGTLDRLPGPDDEAGGVEPPATVAVALEDDLNTPRATAELFEIVRRANAATGEEEQRRLKGELLAGGLLLGLLQQDPDAWLKGETAVERSTALPVTPKKTVAAGTAVETSVALPVTPIKTDRQRIERLVAERAEARKAKDFARADAIREQLAAEGVILEDGPEGTRWRLAG